jgi:predicted membrane protein
VKLIEIMTEFLSMILFLQICYGVANYFSDIKMGRGGGQISDSTGLLSFIASHFSNLIEIYGSSYAISYIYIYIYIYFFFFFLLRIAS